MSSVMSANIILAETVIDEKQLDLLTCVRIMNLLTLAPGNNFVSFYSVAFVGCFPGDTGSHTMTAQVLTSTEKVIATAREHVFRLIPIWLSCGPVWSGSIQSYYGVEAGRIGYSPRNVSRAGEPRRRSYSADGAYAASG